MTRSTFFVFLVLIGLLAVGLVSASAGEPQGQPSATKTPVDVSALGPQVGELVPEFSLQDQTGMTWTLPSIMGPRGAMLVFVRSADW